MMCFDTPSITTTDDTTKISMLKHAIDNDIGNKFNWHGLTLILK